MKYTFLRHLVGSKLCLAEFPFSRQTGRQQTNVCQNVVFVTITLQKLQLNVRWVTCLCLFACQMGIPLIKFVIPRKKTRTNEA